MKPSDEPEGDTGAQLLHEKLALVLHAIRAPVLASGESSRVQGGRDRAEILRFSLLSPLPCRSVVMHGDPHAISAGTHPPIVLCPDLETVKELRIDPQRVLAPPLRPETEHPTALGKGEHRTLLSRFESMVRYAERLQKLRDLRERHHATAARVEAPHDERSRDMIMRLVRSCHPILSQKRFPSSLSEITKMWHFAIPRSLREARLR
jgi:hypothetical protein